MPRSDLTPEQLIIYELSERIVAAQKPIQILDAIKWTPEIKERFFAEKCKNLPAVDANYYQNIPLRFDLDQKAQEFHEIERDINRKLGQFSGIGSIMLRTCREYRIAIQLLKARGTQDFYETSVDLYGSASEAFYPGGPVLNDLSDLLSETLGMLQADLSSEKDEKKYTSTEAVEILNERLAQYFHHKEDQVAVLESDNIVSDAAAGARYIKMRQDAMFSERDIQLLEVHEGWVHVGTSINGSTQPICTFLGKGAPSCTITQEGLAVITEIFTFSSYPARVQRITNRIKAIHMAEQGADFLEVFYHFTKEMGVNEQDAYSLTARIFRGSTPTLGPFTKDLSYAKGFLLIYNYIRLAVQMGLSQHVPTLFVGKLRLEDIQILNHLVEEGIVTAPRYVPPQFKDLAALSSWMCFSLFLNRVDLKKLAENYKQILHH
jgi:uncharacterized protein (TIGR02421 family)